jgi:prepilin-type N-terminal cleavage/methylation domain-containing protein
MKERGFTLIEMVVVLLLFGIVFTGVLMLYDQHNKIYDFQQAYVKANGSARNVVEQLVNHGRQASEIIAARNMNGIDRVSDTSSIILQLPSVNPTGILIPGSSDYVVYYLEGTKLWQEIDASAGSLKQDGKKLLSESASSLSFTYDNADFEQVRSVNVDFRTQESFRRGVVAGQLSQVFYLRNR